MLPCCYNPRWRRGTSGRRVHYLKALRCCPRAAGDPVTPRCRGRADQRLRSPSACSHAPAGRPYPSPFPLSLPRPLGIHTLYSGRASRRPTERWRRIRRAGGRAASVLTATPTEHLTHARAGAHPWIRGGTAAPHTSQDLHDLAHVTSVSKTYSVCTQHGRRALAARERICCRRPRPRAAASTTKLHCK